MKKYLLIFLLACSAAWTAQAQTTFNIRAGGGYGTKLFVEEPYGVQDGDMGGSVSILLQTNIGLNRRATFSPTFMYSHVLNSDDINKFAFPLFFGYKIPFANAVIFYPKFGPCVGVTIDGDWTEPIAGPAIELAIEKRHLVVAFDYYYSACEGGNHQLAFTVGYKF